MIHTLEIAIGSPELWAISIAVVLALFGLDFLITRKPHEVSMKEAIGWSAFYIALPLTFGVWVWQAFGSQRGLEFYAGYLVEKSLSVDNLFVFMLLLSSFAVPRELQQRVLLIGVAGALVLRGVFIALGAAMLANFAWTFLLFGLILLATAVKVLRDTLNPAEHEIHPNDLRIVKLVRRFWPVSDGYRGPRMSVVEDGKRVMVFQKEAYDDAIRQGHLKFTANIVEPAAREFISYLAANLDADGGTTVIYWACGDGSAYEVAGDFTAEQCKGLTVAGPV